MTDNKLDVLVIGAGMYVCGRGTDGYGTVLPAIFQAQQSDLINSVTVCATSRQSCKELEDKTEGIADLFGYEVDLQTYPRHGRDTSSYLKAIDENDFDCAIVVVPDHLHHEIATDTIEAGLNTFVVKPFVPTLEEGIELTRLADEHDVYTGVEFHKRYDASNLIMRDKIRDGEVGDPLYFVVEYSQRKTIPTEVFRGWAEQTNIFQYLGVHYADMVHFLTGARPRRVMSVGQKNWLVDQGVDTWDSMETLIEWETDDASFVSTHMTNWIDPNETSAMSDQKIKVIGTEGRVECDQKHRGVQTVLDDEGVEDINPYFSRFFGPEGDVTFKGYGCDSFLTFFNDLMEIADGADPAVFEKRDRPTFRSALTSTAIVEASNQSVTEDGEWIEVDDALQNIL